MRTNHRLQDIKFMYCKNTQNYILWQGQVYILIARIQQLHTSYPIESRPSWVSLRISKLLQYLQASLVNMYDQLDDDLSTDVNSFIPKDIEERRMTDAA